MWWGTGMKKKERNSNMGQWSQGNPPPNSTQPTPESISEPSSALCSTLLVTSLSKTNSPAIPLALPSGATGVMKGPEEVEVVVAVGLQSALCVCERVCAKCVWQVWMRMSLSYRLCWQPGATDTSLPSSRSKGSGGKGSHCGLDI